MSQRLLLNMLLHKLICTAFWRQGYEPQVTCDAKAIVFGPIGPPPQTGTSRHAFLASWEYWQAYCSWAYYLSNRVGRGLQGNVWSSYIWHISSNTNHTLKLSLQLRGLDHPGNLHGGVADAGLLPLSVPPPPSLGWMLPPVGPTPPSLFWPATGGAEAVGALGAGGDVVVLVVTVFWGPG